MIAELQEAMRGHIGLIFRPDKCTVAKFGPQSNTPDTPELPIVLQSKNRATGTDCLRVLGDYVQADLGYHGEWEQKRKAAWKGYYARKSFWGRRGHDPNKLPHGYLPSCFVVFGLSCMDTGSVEVRTQHAAQNIQTRTDAVATRRRKLGGLLVQVHLVCRASGGVRACPPLGRCVPFWQSLSSTRLCVPATLEKSMVEGYDERSALEGIGLRQETVGPRLAQSTRAPMGRGYPKSLPAAQTHCTQATRRLAHNCSRSRHVDVHRICFFSFASSVLRRQVAPVVPRGHFMIGASPEEEWL